MRNYFRSRRSQSTEHLSLQASPLQCFRTSSIQVPPPPLSSLNPYTQATKLSAPISHRHLERTREQTFASTARLHIGHRSPFPPASHPASAHVYTYIHISKAEINPKRTGGGGGGQTEQITRWLHGRRSVLERFSKQIMQAAFMVSGDDGATVGAGGAGGVTGRWGITGLLARSLGAAVGRRGWRVRF